MKKKDIIKEAGKRIGDRRAKEIDDILQSLNEPIELDNDLEERLLSARNTIDLTILALHDDRHELIPTGIEDAYYKMQNLLDAYCVEK